MGQTRSAVLEGYEVGKRFRLPGFPKKGAKSTVSVNPPNLAAGASGSRARLRRGQRHRRASDVLDILSGPG